MNWMLFGSTLLLGVGVLLFVVFFVWLQEKLDNKYGTGKSLLIIGVIVILGTAVLAGLGSA